MFRQIVQALADGGLRVAGFGALSLHEDPELPLGELCRIFDLLSSLGDRIGHPALKAMGLFLGMTLFGPTERFVIHRQAPDVLVTDRHPILDCLVYSHFYLPRLERPIAPFADRLAAGLAEAGRDPVATMAAVEAWIERLPEPLCNAGGFRGLPIVLAQLFERPARELLGPLEALFGTPFPDCVVRLQVPVATACDRIEARASNAGAAAREMHESRLALEGIHETYRKTLALLETERPVLRVVVNEGVAHDWCEFLDLARPPLEVPCAGQL